MEIFATFSKFLVFVFTLAGTGFGIFILINEFNWAVLVYILLILVLGAITLLRKNLNKRIYSPDWKTFLVFVILILLFSPALLVPVRIPIESITLIGQESTTSSIFAPAPLIQAGLGNYFLYWPYILSSWYMSFPTLLLYLLIFYTISCAIFSRKNKNSDWNIRIRTNVKICKLKDFL